MRRFREIWDAVKALPAGAPAPNVLGFTPGVVRRISNIAAERYSQAYGGKQAIDYVMECVSLYARTTSNADYYFKTPDGRRVVANPRAPEYKGMGYGTADADLVELVKHPNRREDYTAFMQLAVIDLLLAGEFIWLRNVVNGLGQTKELYRLPPHMVEVKTGRVEPSGYVYHPDGVEPQTYTPDQIVHVRLPNPHDPWRGLSVIAGDPSLFDTALALGDSIRDYYERGTRLTGVVESDRPVTQTTWDKMKREFTNLYSGRGNSWGVAWLQRAKFNPLSANAAEAQFVEASGLVRDRIAALFGVPTPLLGDVGGSTDRQAVREAQRIFDTKIMRPFLDFLQAQISQQLTLPEFGVDFCIEYEYTVPAEDKLQLAQVLAGQPLLVKELRAFLGYEPLGDERDDKLWVELAGSFKPATPPGGAPLPPGKTLAGDAPYPAGAAGRTGEPTTADATKANPEFDLRAAIRRMQATRGDE